MKKAMARAFAARSVFSFTSCGQLGSTSTSSNSLLTQQSGGLSSLLTGIGGVLSNSLGVNTTSSVGTWVYQQPAVLFESDNLLAKAGGQIAAQSLADKMDTYCQKAGIKPGKLTMTFDNAGKFTQTIGTKTQSGTYTVSNGTVNLTYSGGTGQIVGTTQFDGSNLVIVVDMTKLLSFAQNLTANSSNSTLSALSSVTKSFNGMKAGLKFSKQ